MSELDDDADMDDRLTAAFERARVAYEDDGFDARVDKALAAGGLDRRRLIVLGGAGSVGTAAAGSQVENLLTVAQNMNTAFGGALTVIGPDTIVALMLAVPVSIVAWMLPNRTRA